MIENTAENQNLISITHGNCQKVVQLNKKTENFQIEEKIEKSPCLISYEPELIDKSEIHVETEMTFYDDVTKILNEIPKLKAEKTELQQKLLN